MWAGLPSQRISPSVGSHSPEMVLIVTDLPAPLSPTSAVILPDGTERLTLLRAWTAPNTLLTPRSSRSGVAPSVMCWPPFATTARVRCFQQPTPAPSPGTGGRPGSYFVWLDNTQTGVPVCPRLPGDARRGAVGRVRAGAELRCRDEVVLYDRGVHVLRGHPCRSQKD